MAMDSPEYPDEPIDVKSPPTNSLPMHGFDEDNSDSDNDNEGPNDGIPSLDPYAGYQQLNLDDVPHDAYDDDDEANVEEPDTDNHNPTAEIACQVWNAPRPNELDIKIDSTKCDEIKSVMSKVTLGAIEPPEWAKHIPETKWIEELLQEVRRNKSTGNHNPNQITPPDTSNDAASSNK